MTREEEVRAATGVPERMKLRDRAGVERNGNRGYDWAARVRLKGLGKMGTGDQ